MMEILEAIFLKLILNKEKIKYRHNRWWKNNPINMYKMPIFYLIISILLMVGCIDDDFPPMDDDCMNCPIDTTECPNYESDFFKIVWQEPLHPDTLFTLSMKPQILEDKIVYSDKLADNNENLTAFDIQNGNRLWNTPDFEPSNQGINTKGGEIIYNGDLYISFFLDLYKIDGDQGAIDWHYRFESGGPRNAIIGTNIYYCERIKNGAQTTKARVVRSGFDQPNWQVIYQQSITNGFEPDFESFSLYKNALGDSILIFQNRSWNFQSGINHGKVDLIAFNLDKMQVEWEVEDLTEFGNSAIYPPIIHDGFVYFFGSHGLYKLAAETGELLWSNRPGGDFLSTPPLLHENRIYNISTGGIFYVFDIETGDVIIQLEVNPNVTNMDIYKGVVYFTSKGFGKLMAINLSTFQTLFNVNSSNEVCTSSASLQGGVTIDQETGFLYTHDQYFAMCLDLN